MKNYNITNNLTLIDLANAMIIQNPIAVLFMIIFGSINYYSFGYLIIGLILKYKINK